MSGIIWQMGGGDMGLLGSLGSKALLTKYEMF